MHGALTESDKRAQCSYGPVDTVPLYDMFLDGFVHSLREGFLGRRPLKSSFNVRVLIQGFPREIVDDRDRHRGDDRGRSGRVNGRGRGNGRGRDNGRGRANGCGS